MFCWRCGEENAGTHRYCSKCGANLSRAGADPGHQRQGKSLSYTGRPRKREYPSCEVCRRTLYPERESPRRGVCKACHWGNQVEKLGTKVRRGAVLVVIGYPVLALFGVLLTPAVVGLVEGIPLGLVYEDLFEQFTLKNVGFVFAMGYGLSTLELLFGLLPNLRRKRNAEKELRHAEQLLAPSR